MRLGLLGKVALALTVVGLLPVGTVTWQMTSLNREAMTTQVLRTHAVASRTAAERVAAYLSGILVPVQAAIATPEFERDSRSGESQSLLAGVLQAQPSLLEGVDRGARVAEIERGLAESEQGAAVAGVEAQRLEGQVDRSARPAPAQQFAKHVGDGRRSGPPPGAR